MMRKLIQVALGVIKFNKTIRSKPSRGLTRITASTTVDENCAYTALMWTRESIGFNSFGRNRAKDFRVDAVLMGSALDNAALRC